MTNDDDGARSLRVALIGVGALVLLVFASIVASSLRRPPAPDPDPTTATAPAAGKRDSPRGASADNDGTVLPSASFPVAIADIDSWRQLLKSDPAAAAASLGQMSPDEERDDRLFELMEHWVSTSPDAAGSWLLAQPQGEFRDDSAEEFSLAWARLAPEAAASWVGSHLQSPAGKAAVGALVSEWARQDPSAALAWVEALTEPEAARSATGSLGYAWGQDAPHAAARWAAQIDDPTLKRAAAINLVNAWSETDPDDAAVWVATGLSDPALRDAAALTLIHTWADNDPRAASQWIAGLGSGELLESAKTVFAESLAYEAPKDAVVWARSIDDPVRRNEAILNIYEDWIETDKPALIGHLRSNLDDHADAELRDGVYDLLYDHDPDFRAELLQLFEEQAEAP